MYDDQIVLTEFDLFPDLHRLHVTSMMSIIEAPGRILTDKMQIHFIQLPKKPDETFTRGVNELLIGWLSFFNFPRVTSEEEFTALAEKDEGLQMAVTEYAKFRSDTELRELYRQREKTRHDILSYTKTMVRKGREGKTIELAKSRLLKRFGQLNPTIIRRFDEMFENLPSEAECDRIFELALDCASLEEFDASL